MVESNEPNQLGTQDSFAFFDEIFTSVPEPFRRTETLEVAENKGKKSAKKKQQKQGQQTSLADLQRKIEDKRQSIQQANREKSLAKIQELRIQHQEVKKQAQGQGGQLGKRRSSSDMEEESKEQPKKKYESKGKVSEEKLQNKRKYKEARKKLKEKKSQGQKIQKPEGEKMEE